MPEDKDSVEAALADRKWWRLAADVLGYKLFGWTYRNSATFMRPDKTLLEVTGADAEVLHEIALRTITDSACHSEAKRLLLSLLNDQTPLA
ncbi:MAG: hypothetical protein ACXADB_12900 [Candidatus Hermodarchaeia archaeon]|jgi:hypothetical protein